MDRIDRVYAQKQEQMKTDNTTRSGECYDLTEDKEFLAMSFMQRKARYTEFVLDHTKVRLLPDELLAGTILRTWPRVNYSTLAERKLYCDMGLAFPRRNNRIIDGKEHYSSKALRLTPEEIEDPNCERWSWGHSCIGFVRLLEMGYNGIIKDAQSRIDAMQASGQIDPEKIEFWQAVITCSKAVCRLSDRYSEALTEAAAAEPDAVRAAELRQMAAATHAVPANPPKTFREAMQSVWFIFLANLSFNCGADVGRLDQYLYPYYRKDVDEGILTPDEAQELIDCLFLKFFECYVTTQSNAGLHPGIILGGLKEDGKDGTNELTYMLLRATERLMIPAPKLSVRVNEQTPDEIFEIAHRMLLKGLSQPDFYSDHVMINAFQSHGVPFEDAIQYAQSICEEISLAGISEDCVNEGPHCDVHDKVELAMQRVCAGEVAETFEDFLVMVEEEIRKCILEEMEFHMLQTEKIRTFNPHPLHSASIVGCLESGKDIMAGGAKYNNTGSVIGGLATASDGLYAIKTLVYDTKRLTIPEFHQILVDNYENNELLRLEILNKFPKFGNDDDRVDSIAVRLFDVYADELKRHHNSRGGIYKIGAWASEYRSSYMATPDGRRQGDTFATNISPTPGRDLKGVTAVMRSGTKLNMKICSAGCMLDIAMNPSCIRGENGAQILKYIVTSYGAMGGGGLQFNIVDGETLRKAQEDPDAYRNLMVRVWGYNDYFTALPEHKQAHIISRTIHGVV